LTGEGRTKEDIYFFYNSINPSFFLAKHPLFFYYTLPCHMGGPTSRVQKGLSMSKNIIGNLMKQAQQMQERVKKLQEEAAGKTVEASSGGGMVTVVANGRQEVLSLKIDASVVDPKDIEMLQDLVTAAVNEALRKSQELMKDEMAKLTAGMGLPPGLI
jgi:nucleoid-associated protein EbfC